MTPTAPATRRRFAAFLYSQFFSALNDNVHYVLVAFYLASPEVSATPTIAAQWQLTASAAFVLPFVIFSPLAGALADRFNKRSVLIAAKWLELVPMGVSLGSTLLPPPVRYWGLIAGVFLMEVRATFFSPAKYGILPEVTAPDRLVFANGLLQLFTMVAIVSGEAVGGLFLEHLGVRLDASLRRSILACLVLAIVGALASFAIPRGRPGHRSTPIRVNPLGEVCSTFRQMRQDRALVIILATLSFFWLVSALFRMNMPIFGQYALHVSKVRTSVLWAVLSMGIGAGAFLAGLVRSAPRAMRLVVPAALGMGLASIGLSLWGRDMASAACGLALLGLFGGLYLVPQMAIVQERSPAERRGAYAALQNFATNLFMCLASFVFLVMTRWLHGDSARVFLAIGIGLVAMGLVQALLMRGLAAGRVAGRRSSLAVVGGPSASLAGELSVPSARVPCQGKHALARTR